MVKFESVKLSALTAESLHPRATNKDFISVNIELIFKFKKKLKKIEIYDKAGHGLIPRWRSSEQISI